MPDRRIVMALVVLAIVARLGAIAALRPDLVPRSTYEHGEIAANLLAGRGFSVRYLGADGPTSQQAPLYPALVALAYLVGGVEAPRSLLILEVGQAIVGGLLAWSVVRLSSEVAPGRRRVAAVAGLVSAVHPTLVYASTHVQVVSVACWLLAGTLAAGYRAGRTARMFDAALAGLWLGALCLADPILGLAGFGVAWAIGRGQGVARGAGRLGVVGLVAVMMIFPWVVRNYRVHGEFVPIKSSFGYAFWQGNCALSEGTDKVARPSARAIADRPAATWLDQNRALWEARHEAGYIDDIALTPDDYRRLAEVSEPERGRILFRRAFDDLKADPTRYPRLCLRRLTAFVFFDETNPKTRSRVYRAAHLGLTALAALGLILAAPEVRRSLGPTLLVAGLIATFHALTIVSARFHVPIEPLMGLWAAAGLSRWDRPGETLGPGDADG